MWFAMLCMVYGSGGTVLLGDVLDAVEKHSPVIAAAQADVRIAQAEWLASKGGFDTQFKTQAQSSVLGYYNNNRVDALLEQPTSLWGTSFFAGWRFSEGSLPSYDDKWLTGTGGELRMGLNLPLWRNGLIDRRRAGLQKAFLGVSASQQQQHMQKVELQRVAAHKYYQWVASFERYRVATHLLKLAVDRDNALQTRVDAGDLASLDAMDNRRSVMTRQQQVIAAERLLRQYALELSMYYRDEAGQPWVVEQDQCTSLEKVPLLQKKTEEAVVLEEVLKTRPDYQRLMVLKEQAEVEKKFQKNQAAPSVDVQLMASQDVGQRSASQRPTDLQAGLVLEIPLQRRLQRGRVDASEEALNKIHAQLQWLSDQIAVSLKDSASAFEKAQERFAVASQETQLAERLAELEGKRFELGDGNIIFLNVREQTAAESEIRKIDAWLDTQRAGADYKAAQGLLQR
jgi:cobalt-zinc-cadmium efflux system outer membrane protein